MSDSVTVKTQVTNNGKYQVNESVQVYIKHINGEDYEPGYQLKGINNIFLEPGVTMEVETRLNARDFAVIKQDGQCAAIPGNYIISIGGHQPDKRSEELTGCKAETFVIKRTGEETEIEY